MKFIFALMLICAATTASAKNRGIASDSDCATLPNTGGLDKSGIIKQILSSPYCYEAAQLAEKCTFGDAQDVEIAGAAQQFCEKSTPKLSVDDTTLRDGMIIKCNKRCNVKSDGEPCQSTIALCKLDVARFINSVNVKSD